MIKKLFILLIVNQACYAKTQNKHSFIDCGENQKAIQLAQLIAQNQNQKRSKIFCNKALSRAAAFKARNMAEQNVISHYANNKSPNEILRFFKIPIPEKYSKLGNQVEAVSGGYASAQVTLDYFLSSEDHKNLLLGIGELFNEQDQIGVGYYNDRSKKHEDYWVVYTTSLGDSSIKKKNSNKMGFKHSPLSFTKAMVSKKGDFRYSASKRNKYNKNVKSSSSAPKY
jgi:uncharacterized protein YkwD